MKIDTRTVIKIDQYHIYVIPTPSWLLLAKIVSINSKSNSLTLISPYRSVLMIPTLNELLRPKID